MAESTGDPDLDLWPALSFHYGLSFRDLREMPRWARAFYAATLPELLASAALSDTAVSAYPHLKRSHQKTMIRTLERRAEPKPPPVEPKTIEEHQALAAASGIAMVIEKPSDGPGPPADG